MDRYPFDAPGRRSTHLLNRHLAAIGLAAIEGAFQLSVSARGVMPTGYAANALMELVEARLGGSLQPREDGTR